MTFLKDEKCSVYFRIMLSSEKERDCEKGNAFFSFGVPKEDATDIRFSLAFVLEKSSGLRYEAFLKNGAVLLGLSHVSPLQLDQWKQKGELVKITDVTLSSHKVFEAFEKVAPEEGMTQPAGKCNSWMVPLLKELGVAVPDFVAQLSNMRWEAKDAATLTLYLRLLIEELRFLLKDNDQNEEVQVSPVGDKHAVRSQEENQKQTTANNSTDDHQGCNEKETDSRMTYLEDEQCSVYHRISLSSDNEQGYEKGTKCFSSAVSKEAATPMSLVFVFEKSSGLERQVFLKNGAQLLDMSNISPNQLRSWKRKGELVKIADKTFSSRKVFEAIVKTAMEEKMTQLAENRKSWVVTLLEELGIAMSNNGKDLYNKRWKAFDATTLKEDEQTSKDLHLLSNDNDLSEELQAPPVGDTHATESKKENEERTTPMN